MNVKQRFRTDCAGRPLKCGGTVRVCRVPNLKGMAPETLAERMPVFQYAVGKKFRIFGFDQNGLAAIDFYIPVGKHKGMHTIFVEPHQLRKCYE